MDENLRLPGVQSRRISRILPVFAAIVFFYAATESYLSAAINTATHTPFWIDEVLAVWAARLPTTQDITKAIWKGAEFSPPTYDLFLHFIFKAFGSSPLIARLPSIAAILCAAIAVAWIIWRRLGLLPSALAFGLVLNSPLFAFAVQARPYAILVAVVAMILVLWSDYARGISRPIAIGMLLFVSISMHVYAVLVFVVVGLMEMLESIRSRRIRPAMWAAFVAACLGSLAWLPLIFHLSKFNSGDTGSPEFYGAPTLVHLIDHFDALFRGSTIVGVALLTILMFVAASITISVVWQPSTASRSTHADDGKIAIMAGVLLATLPVGFLLAVAVTHVFSARYALPATIGAILLLVLGLQKLPFSRLIGGTLCIMLAVLPLLHGVPSTDAAKALVLLDGKPSPIVVSDSNLFVELMEDAPNDLRARLFHMTKPPGVTDGDTSADHQLERLVASFRSDLPVVDPKSFFTNHRQFTEVCRPGRSTDALCAWLITKGRVKDIAGLGGPVTVLDLDVDMGPDHP